MTDRPRKAKQSVQSVQGEAPRRSESEVRVRDESPRRSGRHVPAAVKREVFARDAGCCSYVDDRGERCREIRYLELRHLQPYAQNGQHVATNLSLRCAAHNALAAEEDFGRERVERKRNSATHESFAAQARAEGVPALETDF